MFCSLYFEQSGVYLCCITLLKTHLKWMGYRGINGYYMRMERERDIVQVSKLYKLKRAQFNCKLYICYIYPISNMFSSINAADKNEKLNDAYFRQSSKNAQIKT